MQVSIPVLHPMYLQPACSLTLIFPDLLCTVTKKENRKEQQHLQHPPFHLSSKGSHCPHLQQQLPLQQVPIILTLLQPGKGSQQPQQQTKKDQPTFQPSHYSPHQKPTFGPAGSGLTFLFPLSTLHSTLTTASSLHSKPSLL